MRRNSNRLRIATAIMLGGMLCGGMLAGCAQSSGVSSESPSNGSTAGQIAEQVATDIAEMDFTYSERDGDASYDAASATKLTLTGADTAIEGTGVMTSDGVITITEAGTYVMTGTSQDARILVNAPDDAKVQIVLDGVTMTSGSGPCIQVDAADKVFVTLAQGSQNSLSDGAWSLTGADDESDATIYSVCDLTINGAGSLAVNATVNDGISTKDDLKICGGTVSVTAADDALHGNDSVMIGDAVLVLEAGGDGIKSSKDDDPAKGFVTLDGGSTSIVAADDGIQAARLVRVTGGTLDIASQDDAMNSDVDILIDGGATTVEAGDDAAHGEYYVDIVSGSFTATSCVEGLEGQVVEIAGGDVRLETSDDGINASAVEVDGVAPDTSEACKIIISGGKTVIAAQGDGLDSNGTLEVSGGETHVFGPTAQGNGALDSALGATITGGVVYATSAGGMEESFGSSSTQASVVAQASGNAGDVVSVVDSSGVEIASFTAERAYSWLLVSSPALVDGESYIVKVNGGEMANVAASMENQMSGSGGPGGMRGGKMSEAPGEAPNEEGAPQSDMRTPPQGEMPQGERPSPPATS